jgi:hypothetical protein
MMKMMTSYNFCSMPLKMKPANSILVVEATGKLPPSVTMGVMILLQANYQAAPDDVPKLRLAAEIKLTPYRIGWGI